MQLKYWVLLVLTISPFIFLGIAGAFYPDRLCEGLAQMHRKSGGEWYYNLWARYRGTVNLIARIAGVIMLLISVIVILGLAFGVMQNSG